MRQWNENVATASTILMFAAFPTAVVTELLGQTDLARFSLWAVVASIIGFCVAFAPEADKKETMARLDIHIREFLSDCIAEKFPRYNEERVIRRGAEFIRQCISPRIDPRHTYLNLLLLMEHKAVYLRKTEDGRLTWFIEPGRFPRFRYLEPQERGKCFSCLYWSDPYDEAEECGKDSDKLNCAVNPLHQDTQNGCEHYCDDWRKADLSESWAIRS